MKRTTLVPGSSIVYKGNPCKLMEILSLDEAVVKDAQGETITCKVADLAVESSKGNRKIDLSSIDIEKWQSAMDIYRQIRQILEKPEKLRTVADVDQAAHYLRCSRSTMYRHLDDYRKHGEISALLRKPRSDFGKSRLPSEIESIISQTIEDEYLNEHRRSIATVQLIVKKKCREAGLPAPHESTLAERIKKLPKELVTRRRLGKKYADERFSLHKGAFPNASYPLAAVQIDHTPMDIIIVDDEYRQPIGRPFLTIALDVFSKMIVGFYISLDHAGALATGQCLSIAMLRKEKYLQSMGLDPEKFPWPCWGKMGRIHTDNAKEFHGNMLSRAVAQHGIIAEKRPAGQPRYGGGVERAFRTFMARVHEELPGTTFSNIKSRVDYDPEGKAIMSLGAVQKWFTVYVAGYYHQSPHKGNDNFPPIYMWKKGLLEGTADQPARGLPRPIEDEEQLRLDFLPYFLGTVQEYGIQFEHITWTDGALKRLIHIKDSSTNRGKKYVIRYDPRDLSRIWLYEDVSKMYIEVRYANILRPPVSLWEVRSARAKLRKESKAAINEELIFQAIALMRQIVEEEAEIAKSSRKQLQKQKSWAAVQQVNLVNHPPRETKLPIDAVSDEDDDFDFDPSDGIREA
ncbi:MAG: Mu transposase C-terminal domain-containing protein [Xylophilus ampelinus]